MKLYGLIIFIIIHTIKCEENDDGYMHIDNKHKLKLYEPAIDIHNFKYPNPAPAALLQTWTFSSYPWIRLKFFCTKISIPQESPCQNNYLEIKDNLNTEKYCGEIKDLLVLSQSNKLIITLKTSKSYEKEGAIIDCQIEGFNPEFTTLSPPTTTKSYLDFESIEIDSSEYGMAAGVKNTTCPCGWANKRPERIIGGRITQPNEFPFMAALVSKEVGIPFCGATIITHYHAITAAHCTIMLIKYEVDGALLVGEHDYMKDSNIVDVYNILKIIQHENYDSTNYINDISLVLVDRKIMFSQVIGRVCLPSTRLNLDHKYVTMLGWGRTAFNGTSSKILRKVNVRVIPMTDCLDVWNLFIPGSDPKHICTYAKGKTSCKGDSGGPVLWLDQETNRYTLVGLTSFGLNCSPNIPSVKTEVAAFLDWIYYHIEDSNINGHSETCIKK